MNKKKVLYKYFKDCENIMFYLSANELREMKFVNIGYECMRHDKIISMIYLDIVFAFLNYVLQEN